MNLVLSFMYTLAHAHIHICIYQCFKKIEKTFRSLNSCAEAKVGVGPNFVAIDD